MTAPVRIHPADEAALDWYYGEGQSLFQRSTFGSMLDRQALFAVDLRPTADQRALIREHARERPWEAPPFQVTARPGSPQHQPAGYLPDDSALWRYARVSRWVDALQARDVTAAAVLAAYYGDVGARWGRTPHGRLLAVYPLTDAGRQILRQLQRRGRVARRLHTSPVEELGAVLDVQHVQPQPARRLLLEAARRQALAAYERACTIFVEVREVRGGTP